MALSPDYTVYLRTARMRAQRTSPRWLERCARALAAAQRAADYIKARCPQAQVRLFGSTLYPDAFGPNSDIDLAVDGIEWPEYFRVWSALEKQEPDFVIDLVDVAIASPELRAHIEQEGQQLIGNADTV